MTDRIDVDYSERAGFLTGKAAAIAEWSHKREKRQFAKLIARLAAAKRFKDDPEHVRSIWRRFRERNRTRLNAEMVARRAKVRKPKICVCVVCGDRKRVKQVVRGGVRFTCSTKCRNKYWSPIRLARKRRGLRTMSIRPDIFAVLRDGPAQVKEIAARCPHLKRRSIITTVYALARAGQLVVSGSWGGKGAGARSRVYAIAIGSQPDEHGRSHE